MTLFPKDIQTFLLPDAKLIYNPCFYDNTSALQIFNSLKEEILWQQDEITLFGKTHKQPRLTSLYATNSIPYSYSNITMRPHKMTQLLLKLLKDVESATNEKFTTILLNFYRHGKDSNGWHADNEKELGSSPTIASLSFGETRKFQFKHRNLKTEKHQLDLTSGSLLIMKPPMQQFWLHQIPKTQKEVGERINLTFRKIE